MLDTDSDEDIAEDLVEGDAQDISDGDASDLNPDTPDLTPVCEPDRAYCDDEGDSRQCTSDGLAGELIEPCVATCLGGVCQPSTCGDGVVDAAQDETCDDANSSPCDGCDSCVRLRSGVLAETTLTSSDAAWIPGSSNFTLEAWVSPSTDGALFGIGDTSSGDYALVEIESGVAIFSFKIGEVVIDAVGTTTLTDGWHHLAAVRFDAWSAAVFVDGRVEAIIDETHDGTEIGGAGLIWLGSEGNLDPVSGLIDEVRFSETARYDESFTPTRFLDSDEQTVALYHLDGISESEIADSSDNDRTLTVDGWSQQPDACYGTSPGAAVCGDGELAPWESCDEDTETCSSCVRRRDCAGHFDPSGHCVRFGPTDKWTDARSICIAYDATMYVIENQLENDWLTHMIGLSQNHWIGLNDRDNEGNYEWSNGSAAGYRNWDPEEPNNSGNEDCIEIRPAGGWNDEGCRSSRPFICQMN